jgi:hypothetical protein
MIFLKIKGNERNNEGFLKKDIFFIDVKQLFD